MKYLVYDYFDGGGYYESQRNAIHKMCVVEADTEREAKELGANCMRVGWICKEDLLVISFDKLVHGFKVI